MERPLKVGGRHDEGQSSGRIGKHLYTKLMTIIKSRVYDSDGNRPKVIKSPLFQTVDYIAIYVNKLK